MAGIQKATEIIDDLAVIAANAISIARKGGLNLTSIPQLVAIAGAATELLLDAREAYPEFKDLDQEEMAVLGAHALTALDRILKAAA